MAVPISVDAIKFEGDGSYERLPAGAYVCKVIRAEHYPDKQYVLLYLDIAEGEYAGFGEKTEERTGKTFGYLRKYCKYDTKPFDNPFHRCNNSAEAYQYMLARFEAENKGKFSQTDREEAHLVGLLVGATCRVEEYEAADGEIKEGVKFADFVEIAKVRAGKVKTPKPKLIKKTEPPLIASKAVPDDGSIPF